MWFMEREQIMEWERHGRTGEPYLQICILPYVRWKPVKVFRQESDMIRFTVVDE